MFEMLQNNIMYLIDPSSSKQVCGAHKGQVHSISIFALISAFQNNFGVQQLTTHNTSFLMSVAMGHCTLLYQDYQNTNKDQQNKME